MCCRTRDGPIENSSIYIAAKVRGVDAKTYFGFRKKQTCSLCLLHPLAAFVFINIARTRKRRARRTSTPYVRCRRFNVSYTRAACTKLPVFHVYTMSVGLMIRRGSVSPVMGSEEEFRRTRLACKRVARLRIGLL